MAKDEPDLLKEAEKVLKNNDRGKWIMPAGELYPHQWLWDSCFIAVGLRQLNIERAQTELRSLLRGQWANGMMPDMIFADVKGASLDRILWDSATSPYAPHNIDTSGVTQPPMLAEAVLQIGKKLSLPERRTWYKEMLPAIIEFHQWLYRERDPSKEGLVTLIHPYESGLDNSPPWVAELKARGIPLWVGAIDKLGLGFIVNLIRRDVRHSPANQRMSNVEALAFFAALRRLRRKSYDSKKILNRPFLAVQDLVFNCILIRANVCLEEIAKVAGHKLSEDLVTNMRRSQTALDKLWDEPTGQYYCRSFVSGELIKEPSIATLLALYAGSISQEQAKRLVELIKKSRQFGASWPIPSVPLNSPYFEPFKYWQGPTWINTNWLIIEGLNRYGFDAEASQLRERTLELVAKSGFWEYYNPLNGQPAGAANFSWTAALTIDLLKT